MNAIRKLISAALAVIATLACTALAFAPVVLAHASSLV